MRKLLDGISHDLLRHSLDLWFAGHEKLLVQELLFRRGIADTSCGTLCESNLHPLKKTVLQLRGAWLALLHKDYVAAFFGIQSCREWIDQNLVCQWGGNSDFNWSQVFREAIHIIWQVRNRSRHDLDGHIQPTDVISSRILRRIEELYQAWIHSFITKLQSVDDEL